jgi:hypothetical protein
MSWQDVGVKSLRVIIDDYEGPIKYDDSRLKRLLVVAAMQVMQEACSTITYVVDGMLNTITPEPDQSFTNLIVLKAVCLLAKADYNVSINKAVMFKDGPSSMDGRAVADGKKFYLQDCAANYTLALTQFSRGQAVQLGETITTPVRMINSYGGRRFE